MDLFKNVSLNLSATGLIAALCVLFICIAALGIWGSGFLASAALSGLIIIGVGLVSQLRNIC